MAASLSTFAALVEADDQDLDVLCLADSTGEDINEWVGRFAIRLGDNHPTYTITYSDYWNGGTETWDVSATTIRSGTGSNTIRFWNGGGGGYSVSGVNTAAIIEEPADVDFILTGVGFNGGDSTDWADLLDALETAWPSTATALCTQNPLAANAPSYVGTAEGLVADAAATYGFDVVDVHTAFVDTGNVDAYLKGDGVHPNRLGSDLWASTVYQAIFGGSPMTGTVTVDSATTFTQTTALNLLDTDTSMQVTDLGTWQTGNASRVAVGDSYSGYAIRNTSTALFRQIRNTVSGNNSEIPVDGSTAYAAYFKAKFDANWSTTGVIRVIVTDWNGTNGSARLTITFTGLTAGVEYELYTGIGWTTRADATSVDFWINNNDTGNDGVSGSCDFYDFRFAEGATSTFIPPLRPGTAGDFTKDPTDVTAAFSDPTLTVGDSYAGSVVSVTYRDVDGSGPILAYLSADDIISAFGVGAISNGATWTDSVTGATWTVNGTGATITAGDEPSTGRLLVLGLL